ncbi:hypothetical protein ABIB90_007801 [Bradyrhizobium sp. JR4.1]
MEKVACMVIFCGAIYDLLGARAKSGANEFGTEQFKRGLPIAEAN